MPNLFNAKEFLTARWRARRDGLEPIPVIVIRELPVSTPGDRRGSME